jgi:hypothetical protein
LYGKDLQTFLLFSVIHFNQQFVLPWKQENILLYQDEDDAREVVLPRAWMYDKHYCRDAKVTETGV